VALELPVNPLEQAVVPRTNTRPDSFVATTRGSCDVPPDQIEASDVSKPARIYDLRSTFASNALAAGPGCRSSSWRGSWGTSSR